jgi:hypothetical protein
VLSLDHLLPHAIAMKSTRLRNFPPLVAALEIEKRSAGLCRRQAVRDKGEASARCVCSFPDQILEWLQAGGGKRSEAVMPARSGDLVGLRREQADCQETGT